MYQEAAVQDLSWKSITFVLGLSTLLLSATLILTLNGKDVTAVVSVFSTVFLVVVSVFGVDRSNKLDSKLDQVREMSNGNLTQLRLDNRRLQEQVTALALAVNPKAADDDNPQA
jgi:hypothetical protein